MSVDLSPEERAKLVAERADVKYGPYASLHEAYGVLIEEISEFTEELLNEIGREKVKPDYLPQLVSFMRSNDVDGFVRHVIAVRNQMRNCCEFMLNDRILAEAVDVIAVCDRIIAQWGEPS